MSRLDDSGWDSTALFNGLMDISSLPSLNRLIHLGLPSLQLHGMAAPSRQALWGGQCGFAYRVHSTSPFPGKRRRVGSYRWLIHRCQTGRGSQPHVRRLE
jgi:arylsulfatase A-like enzyme